MLKERQVYKLNGKKSDAFSSYSSVNIKPKNLTSDMWEPITASGNYTAYVPPKQENTQAGQAGKAAHRGAAAQPRESGSVPRQRVPEKNSQHRGAPAKKKKTAKPESNAERPISSGRAEQSLKKQSKLSSGKARNNNKKTAEASLKAFVRRAEKKRDKTNKAFMKLVRGGKSVDEARAIITKRKLRKRKLSTFLSVLFLFFFAVIFVLSYTYCEGAEISEIIIDGDEVYSDSEILSAAQLSEGVNMLTVREKQINDSVTTALPFISMVGVEYELPDTLRLKIISTTERLIIKNGSKYICIDKTGKVVSEKKKKLSEGQFLVLGLTEQTYTVGEMFSPSEDNKEKYDIACRVALAAEGNEIINSGTIDVSKTNDITLTYKSRLRVYLGSEDNLASKLSIAERVMLDNNAQNKTGYINAKYDIGAYFMQGSMQA